ncbi:MAG TPA: class I SAM-dependent methyltransferase [Bryobacteraceae bacterium]|nr:class I SAM-dependent methyltransferase [Bryobacteraceae bacterium]
MDAKGEELAAVIAEIRERVRARNPNGSGPAHLRLPDLTPLLHARDAAEAKVASIGTVNPRAGGLKNSLIQKLKRTVARALDWHIREQVEFNRAIVQCVQATLEALNEHRRAFLALAARDEEGAELLAEARELKDIRVHWAEWRTGWEQKFAQTEIQFLRSVADLQLAFQHRVTLLDESHREQTKGLHADFLVAAQAQHADFERALERQSEKFWNELERVRLEYERLIHSELRLIRQRATLSQAVEQASQSAPPEFAHVDWIKFADRFRGSEDDIRARQQMYAARFRDHAPVLDLGCGRGEMLQVFRNAGVASRGVDSHADSIAICHAKGLETEQADLFAYLSGLPDGSLGGVVCCQVVEHLPPSRLAEMIRLVHAKLRAGGLVAFETPNPECLAIFATHFYIDPTHRHPIPPALASFYLEEAGFGRIQIERLSPAIESMPALAELPESFRKEFFGSLDYAAFGTKIG